VLVALCACNIVPVDVSTRHPTPRPLWPRPVATVKTYEARPPGGVAVYGLQASGEDLGEVEVAIRERAASLGCDGILLTVREDQGTSRGVALTGKLNEAREYVPGHIDALCMVDPASIPEICPAVTRSARTAAATAAAVTTRVDVDGAARDTLEQWRHAYETRSSEALAKLYSHDASLNVVEGGTRLHGWTAFEPALRDRLGRATAIRVRFDDVQVHAAGATAVIVATMLRERSDAGVTATENGSLTLVLQASEVGNDAGWVIVAEHYSKRP
jgi:ketosteroid isomerase-like protein